MKESRIYPKERSVLQVDLQGNKRNPLTGVFACRSLVQPHFPASLKKGDRLRIETPGGGG